MPTPHEMRLAATDPEFKAELIATVQQKIEHLRQQDPTNKALCFELCRLLAERAALRLVPGDACQELDTRF